MSAAVKQKSKASLQSDSLSKQSQEESKGKPSELSGSFKLSAESSASFRGENLSFGYDGSCESKQRSCTSSSLVYSSSNPSQQSLSQESFNLREKSASDENQSDRQQGLIQRPAQNDQIVMIEPSVKKHEIVNPSLPGEPIPGHLNKAQVMDMPPKQPPQFEVINEEQDAENEFDEGEYYYVQPCDLALDNSFDMEPEPMGSDQEQSEDEDDDSEEPKVPCEEQTNLLP